MLIDVPSNFLYKSHPILKPKCFSSRLATVFAQCIEARCKFDNEDVLGAAPTGVLLQLHESDQQMYGLQMCSVYYRFDETLIDIYP